MPSYLLQNALVTLRRLRVEGERQAERALAAAVAGERAAREEEERLATAMGRARTRLEAARARAVAGAPVRAAEVQTDRRYWRRLEAEVGAAVGALAAHRSGPLADAVARVASARGTHHEARRDREVVDKAIARRDAAWRREVERREEAAADDRGAPPADR